MAACAIKPQASSHRPYYIALACSTLRRLTRIHSLARSTLRDEEPIAQLQYWLNCYSKYNIPPKALPLLVCTKNTALGDVSRDKYSTRLRLALYLSLNTPSRAVFSIQTRGSALSNIYSINDIATTTLDILNYTSSLTLSVPLSRSG